MRVNKPVTLDQLEAELAAAGITLRGLGLNNDDLYTYDAAGNFMDLPSAAAAVLSAHVALRHKTHAELRAEFQGASPIRRQEIRDMVLDLLPRDRVAR